MSGIQGGAHVLPPVPPWRGWPIGGACAGAALGFAEVVSGLVLAEALPPRLAVALLLADALAVGLVAGLAGALAAPWLPRLSHSALAGALVGPLLLVPVVAPLLLAVVQGSLELQAAALPALLGLAAAVGCGTLAALVAERLERAGRPVAGSGLWLALAALVVIGARSAAHGQHVLRLFNAQLLLAAVAALCVALFARSRARRAPPRYGQWRLQLVLFLLAGSLASSWPALDAWLFYQPEIASPPDRPGLLLVAFAPEPSAADPFDAVVALLGRETAAYERVVSGAEPPLASLLMLPDGRSLLASLEARGYDTGAVLRDPDAPLAFEANRRDARGGAQRALNDSAASLTGSALLLTLGSEHLRRLGLDRSVRTPQELRRDVGSELLRQRGRRTRTPFALLVDTRAGGTPVAPETFLGDLLEILFELGIEDTTAIAVAVTREPGAATGRLSVALRGAPGLRPDRVASPVPAGALAERLLAVADAETAPLARLP